MRVELPSNSGCSGSGSSSSGSSSSGCNGSGSSSSDSSGTDALCLQQPVLLGLTPLCLHTMLCPHVARDYRFAELHRVAVIFVNISLDTKPELSAMQKVFSEY
jgi:hypothetical protein